MQANWMAAGVAACVLACGAGGLSNAAAPPAQQVPKESAQKEKDAKEKAAAEPSYDASKGYKLEAGAYQAGEADLELTRPDGSVLPIKVRYPKGADGKLPILVFSHGAGGSSEAFAGLSMHLATHGWVVILPTHTDSIKLRRAKGEKDAAKILLDRKELVKNVKPHERAADCSEILDEIDAIQKKIPELLDKDGKGKVDLEKAAIGGHSAGALTAQIGIGVKVRKQGALEPRSYGDERFKAAVIVSGQGTTNLMFTDQSWSEVSKPMLVITGSEDQIAISNDTPKSRREPYEKAKGGDKYLVFIEGATHSSYQGGGAMQGLLKAPKGTDLEMISRVTNSSVHAFLDAYVEGDAKAMAYLGGDDLVQLSRGKTEFLRK